MPQKKGKKAPASAVAKKPPPANAVLNLLEARLVKRFHSEIEQQVDRVLKSNRWYWEHVLQKGSEKMSPKIKAAIVALLTALVEDDNEAVKVAPGTGNGSTAPKKETPKKEEKGPTKDQLVAKAREVVGAFGKAHGKEATRAKLDEFTKGTVADCPPEKLPAMIAAFSQAPAAAAEVDYLG